MCAERRRIIAIVAALTIFAAVGVFWLTRVVLGGARAEFVAGPAGPAATAAPIVPQESPADPADPSLTSEAPTGVGTTPTPGAGMTRTTTTKGATAPTTRRSSPRTTTSPPPPPVPTHAILVGGATLDNDNPRGWCAIFDNKKLGLEVTVTDVRVSGKLRVKAGACATDGQVAGRPACRAGMPLAARAGCFAETTASVKEPGEYKGVVQLHLRARCTSIAVPACDVAELRSSPPTPARPAILTWTDAGNSVCYRVAPPDEDPDPLCREG